MNWPNLWLAIAIVIIIVEIVAVFNDTRNGEDTLTGNIWRWIGIKGHPPQKKWRRVVLFLLMVWLTAHFMGWI